MYILKASFHIIQGYCAWNIQCQNHLGDAILGETGAVLRISLRKHLKGFYSINAKVNVSIHGFITIRKTIYCHGPAKGKSESWQVM